MIDSMERNALYERFFGQKTIFCGCRLLENDHIRLFWAILSCLHPQIFLVYGLWSRGIPLKKFYKIGLELFI